MNKSTLAHMNFYFSPPHTGTLASRYLGPCPHVPLL